MTDDSLFFLKSVRALQYKLYYIYNIKFVTHLF